MFFCEPWPYSAGLFSVSEMILIFFNEILMLLACRVWSPNYNAKMYRPHSHYNRYYMLQIWRAAVWKHFRFYLLFFPVGKLNKFRLHTDIAYTRYCWIHLIRACNETDQPNHSLLQLQTAHQQAYTFPTSDTSSSNSLKNKQANKQINKQIKRNWNQIKTRQFQEWV